MVCWKSSDDSQEAPERACECGLVAWLIPTDIGLEGPLNSGNKLGVDAAASEVAEKGLLRSSLEFGLPFDSSRDETCPVRRSSSRIADSVFLSSCSNDKGSTDIGPGDLKSTQDIRIIVIGLCGGLTFIILYHRTNCTNRSRRPGFHRSLDFSRMALRLVRPARFFPKNASFDQIMFSLFNVY